MREYIITDKQLKTATEAYLEHELSRPITDVFISGDKLPEIVRCGDCKHFTPKGTHKFDNGKVNKDYCDYVRSWMLQITPDGFCAWGERRERESAEVWNQWSADDVTCYKR